MVVHQGEPVYIRSLSTRRAAIAHVTGFERFERREWVHVQLVTAWYDWDASHTEARTILLSGELLFVDPRYLEAVRH